MMEIYDVVKKLIGEISPVGETHIDGKRYSNLMQHIDLIEKLLTDVTHVARLSNYEYSIKKASATSRDFLRDLKEL